MPGGYIYDMFPQGRNDMVKNIQAAVQIFAELPMLHHLPVSSLRPIPDENPHTGDWLSPEIQIPQGHKLYAELVAGSPDVKYARIPERAAPEIRLA